MDDWSAPIDAYCERVGPAFWAEPANAVSNAAFILAALYGLRLWTRAGRRDVGLLALVLLAACVGVGSFLFHTVATRWAMLADVIPIAVFIAAAFGLVLNRLAGLRPAFAVVATVVFMGTAPVTQRVFAPLLGSSAGYGPALVALLLVGGSLASRGVAPARFLLAASGVFAVSIGFRMADPVLCASWPLGTHVGWHLLNGLVLALVMRALARR